jgi:hypothetical protein
MSRAPADSRCSPRIDAELAHQPGEPVGAQPDVEPVLGDLDPLDQQLDDARLLGREDLVPERVELKERVLDLRLGDGVVLAARGPPGADQTSGWRKTARSWSMTAPSISPAGTLPIGQASRPCFSTAWLT